MGSKIFLRKVLLPFFQKSSLTIFENNKFEMVQFLAKPYRYTFT